MTSPPSEGADVRIGITGAAGFLGWHLRCRLLISGHEALLADRATFVDTNALDAFVSGSGAIVHVAGVNRANSDAEVAAGNHWLADQLIAALGRTESVVPVLYTNSTKAGQGGVYGDAKQAAADKLATHQASVGAPMIDMVLPHVFGEYGVPYYNSAVTTFSYALANGEEPQVSRNGQLELLHAQDICAAIVEALESPVSGRPRLAGRLVTVGAVWDLLQRHNERYVDQLTIPSFADRFEQQVFNSLRSQLYLAGHYPHPITLHSDPRGAFAELGRADGLGQTSISTSVPGITRGDHFHVDKIERFIVISGQATIRLRRLFTDEINSYEVSGEAPVYIDMPPLCTHNITNTGGDVMTTMFWAGDHFDPATPDTYIDPVETTPMQTLPTKTVL
jgi:UDP-2-acetamido-2,6-beta-L-arabino-hexul-4-ose reductase